jgi:hypothetical protein
MNSMKWSGVLASLIGIAFVGAASNANAAKFHITYRDATGAQCRASAGTWTFTAHWGALAHPTSKEIYKDPATGLPWAAYKVTPQKYCTVPNGGVVNCGGKTECNIEVTCPIKQPKDSVEVFATGNVVMQGAFTSTANRPCEYRP